MVVLSASICTRGGKALVSRQYVEMTRMRVEGLLAAFPKLVGIAKQHTFVETDTVRYVYQPLENHMYLLLITTKASNIVEDLSTLRLLAKVVPDVAGALQENAINEHAFELIFAFDEVLTAGGYREDTSLSNVRTNLLMDSHEEKMEMMVKASKEEAAKAEMLRKQKEIGNRQKQQLMQSFASQNGMGGMGSNPQPGGMEGFGGGGQPGGNMFEGFGGSSENTGFDPSAYSREQKVEEPEPNVPRVPVKGLKLGTGGAAAKKNSFMAAMAAEDNFSLLAPKNNGGALAPAGPAAAPSAPVTLALEEKITVEMNREGGVENCEVKGTLSVTANTDQGSMITVAVNKAVLAAKCTTNWTIATHPKVDKPSYEKKGLLKLKGAGKGFPLNRSVAVLRWSYASPDAAPLTLNCWPEDQGDGSIMVNIEYELTRSDMTLDNVNILLPLGTTDPPVIHAIDGSYKHDDKAGVLCWHQDIIDSGNSSGSLEFEVPGSDTDAFFPVHVRFQSQSLLCPIEIDSVSSIGDGSTVPNTMTKGVIPETYQCA